MDDAISRQAAIDCEYQVKIINDIEYVMLSEVQMKMRKLPSAQPEKRTEERTESHACDCISRQAAIEAIKEDKIDLTNPNVVAVFKATGDFEKVETQVMTCDRHIEILKDLPSAQLKSYRSYREGYQAGFKDAQPERKRGKWKMDLKRHVFVCSICGAWQVFNCNYCSNCGTDMREVDE